MTANVLHLTYDMRIGGTEQVIKNLIEGTDRSRFEPSIICLETPLGPFGELLLDQGISINNIPRREGFDFRLIFRLRRYLQEKEIDILHCHQYTPWVYGTFAAAMTDTQVLFTEHGRFYPDRSSFKRALVNPILARLTNRITAISKATRQALVDYEYLRNERIEIVYNGIFGLKENMEESARIRDQHKIASSTKVLGTIARLDPIKNQKMMLEAFGMVLQSLPDSVLFIVGDGEERGTLEGLATQLGISDRVIFTGYITHPDGYLNLMDVFLLSSLSEGTSMTLLEAMSLKKPCVVTDAGGNPEIIEHNVNGIVTENGNARAFADGITQILVDEGKREDMSQASLRRFNKYFKVSQMVDKYQNIYHQIA